MPVSMLNAVMVAAEGGSSILDSNVISFVTKAMGDILGILTTPPLGVFLTIGILGTIVGLVGKIVSTVKNS